MWTFAVRKSDHTWIWIVKVGKVIGETAHVECFSNTLRQRLGRPVLNTLALSK